MANTKVKAEQLEAAQTNITSVGTLTALTVDDITIDGSTISDGGDLTIDVAGDINLDADGGDINFKDGGTTYGFASKYNNDLWLGNSISDGDVTIRGNDGGSSISALTFDMSDAGAATFNSTVTAVKLVSTNGVIELDDNGSHNGVINVPASLFINIDSDGNSAGEDFIVGKDRTATSGGTELFRIDSSGDVGIGVTSVTHALEINRSSSSAAYAVVGNGGNVQSYIGVAGDNLPVLGSFTNHDLRLTTNAAEKARIRTDGNVGIGSVGMPSHSSYTQLSIGQMCHFMATTTEASSGSLNISTNAHFDADGSWETMVTGLASNYYQYGGGHYWRVAGSTSAGTDITWKEAMHLNSVGQLTIGNASHNDDVLYLTRGNTGKLLRFYHSGSEVGYISTNTYSLPSDRNVKKDIEDLSLGLDLIKTLKPRQYRQKIEDSDVPLQTGLIAQEFEEALTTAGVDKNKYMMLQHTPDEDETQSQYGIDYAKLIPVLINAIQELSAKLEAK